MDKKSVDMKKNSINFEVENNRSEIEGKVKVDSKKKVGVVKKKGTTDANLEQTMAIETINLLREGKFKKHSEDEKRSEIANKVASKSLKANKSSNVNNIRVRPRKIRLDNALMEVNEDDKVQENVENVSLAMIVAFVLFCVVVCVVVWYMLYQIALTNSDVMAVIFKKLSL